MSLRCLSRKLGRALAARHFLLDPEETNQLEETFRDVKAQIEIKAQSQGKTSRGKRRGN